jgi:hypothetical protein
MARTYPKRVPRSLSIVDNIVVLQTDFDINSGFMAPFRLLMFRQLWLDARGFR